MHEKIYLYLLTISLSTGVSYYFNHQNLHNNSMTTTASFVFLYKKSQEMLLLLVSGILFWRTILWNWWTNSQACGKIESVSFKVGVGWTGLPTGLKLVVSKLVWFIWSHYISLDLKKYFLTVFHLFLVLCLVFFWDCWSGNLCSGAA